VVVRSSELPATGVVEVGLRRSFDAVVGDTVSARAGSLAIEPSLTEILVASAL